MPPRHTPGLRALLPADAVTPADVSTAISTWKTPSSLPTFELIEVARKPHLLLIALVHTPGFEDFVSSLKPFTTSDDLKFGPELCGKDVFDQYVENTTVAFRFLNAVREIPGQNKRSLAFLTTLIEQTPALAEVAPFLTAMVGVIDQANCWPYLPLPACLPRLLFDNPIRQIFGSRRLNGVDPFLHVYQPRPGDDLQMLVLGSCPLLDSPAAICFIMDGQFPFSAVGPTIGLPIGVSEAVFLAVCGRCAAWERATLDGKQNVIDAYHAVTKVVTYRLNGFIGTTARDERTVVVVTKNRTKFQTAPFEPREFKDVQCAIYARI
jgi:hypothetical protein